MVSGKRERGARGTQLVATETEVTEMSDTTRRRLDAATGIAFVVLMTVALFLPGQPPKAEDPIEKITAILIDERSAFLVGSYITGLGAMAYLWFLGSVRDYLRARGAGELTAAASAGGVFAITLLVLGMMMFNGVAFVAARLGDPALVRAFTDTGNIAIEMSKFGFGVFMLAVSRSGASSGLLPRWLVRLGAVSVPFMLASAVSLFMDRGIFQFGGVIDIGGGVPAQVWIVALSVVMMRKSEGRRAFSTLTV